MDKIAIGPGYEDGLVDLDAPAADNLKRLAKAKGVKVSEITACVLDRPRHADFPGGGGPGRLDGQQKRPNEEE
jgi:fructose-1,6-bisphosphatase II / sedoheptulose-1,7-bisphosphatase